MAENLLNCYIPDCLSTRELAGETVDNMRTGRVYLSRIERESLNRVLNVLQDPKLDELIAQDKFTVGLIKPNAFEGRNLPADDEAAEKTVLEMIDPKIIALRLPFKLTTCQAAEFYGSLREKYSKKEQAQVSPYTYNQKGVSVFESIVRFTSSGPLTVLLLSGDNIIARWRDTMGKTNPAEADPNSIRGKYGDADFMPNTLVHGSDSPEQVKNELGVIVNALAAFSLGAERLRTPFYLNLRNNN